MNPLKTEAVLQESSTSALAIPPGDVPPSQPKKSHTQTHEDFQTAMITKRPPKSRRKPDGTWDVTFFAIETTVFKRLFKGKKLIAEAIVTPLEIKGTCRFTITLPKKPKADD